MTTSWRRRAALTLGLLCTPGILAAQAPSAPPPSYSGHGAASVSPEIVAKYAPRPLDPAVSRHIQAMLDIRAPGLGQVTADGSRLYFDWSVTGVNQIFRLDGPAGFPVQMTGGEDATTVASITPDGRFLVVSRDRKGEENPGLYLQPADGGPLREIQHQPGVQTLFQFVSRDSRWIYFSANDQRPDARAIYRWRVADGLRETVFAEEGLWGVDDHRENGDLLLRRQVGARASEYSTWDAATKRRTPLLGQGENVEYAAVFAPSAGELLVRTNKQGEFRRLYLWRAGKLTPVVEELNWDIDEFDLDDQGRRILYTVNEAGRTRLLAVDARSFAPIALPALPEADQVSIGTTSHGGRFTSLGVQTARSPTAAYVLDWETRKFTQWTQPATPEIDTRAFAQPVLEHYPARDGTKIPMWVRRPAQGCPGPCPVVVNFHGGPESQAIAAFSAASQVYVHAGFVLVQPNVRGSDGFGKSWLRADDGPRRLDVISDIEDAAKFIRQAWAVDGVAPRVGISGGSYGGYATLIGMTMFAGAYDAGVSVVGISDLRTFLLNTAPYRRALRVTEYGDPEKDKEALARLSPITYLDRVVAPLLLIQGVSDPRVPVGEALRIHDALQAKGIAADLILFADEGHGARRRDNVAYQLGYSLRFFQEHLQGKKPDAKAAAH